MINMEYDIWLETCELVKKYACEYGKYYYQLYPLYKYNNLSIISSKEYFEKYVLSGAILNNYDSFDKIDNYCKKSDGSYRNRYLLSPIMYIMYTYVGLYISRKYKCLRRKEIYCKYGGDFDNKNLNYKNSYVDFSQKIIDNSEKYKYYLKIDISNFFNNINIDILNKRIASQMKFSHKEQFFFKKFLEWAGNGNFPQTECGTTSSFLATIIYFDAVDNRLYNLLSFDDEIVSFEVCRYVDDLYIFLDFDGRKNCKKIENKIIGYYENLIFDIGLSINKNKSHLRPVYEIYSDMKSFSLFDDELNITEESDENKKYLVNFLNDLLNISEKNGLNHELYNEIIVKYFDNRESNYHASQILSTIIYKKRSWLKETKILKRLTRIIDKDFNIISIDPKRLVALIANTYDEELIKKLLYKLYFYSENGSWEVSHNFIAMQYLLYRNFLSVKLLNKMEKYCPEIVNFITKFYKQDWRKNIISNITDMETKLFSNYKNTNLSLFKFLEIVSLKQLNIIEAQSYNKSYFDLVTANIQLYKGYINKITKVNYQVDELVEIYQNILKLSNNACDKIRTLCNDRNSNPLCHANCKIFDRKGDLSFYIKENINSINEMIYDVLKKI